MSATNKPPIPNKNPLFKLKNIEPQKSCNEKKIHTNEKSIKGFLKDCST